MTRKGRTGSPGLLAFVAFVVAAPVAVIAGCAGLARGDGERDKAIAAVGLWLALSCSPCSLSQPLSWPKRTAESACTEPLRHGLNGSRSRRGLATAVARVGSYAHKIFGRARGHRSTSLPRTT